MAVQHEIKSQLAKLLATEDLIVEHKKVQTACFNVHTRVLTLPMWEKASNTVYDLLVGHEVGHALFTPDENWLEKVAVPMQFVNVVEDARIEKLMKRKYAGLAKTFYNGYRELNDEDFFSISGGDVDDFNLADRANLFFKIGNFLDIKFTEEEMAIIRIIDDCETFDEVLSAAEILYEFCKKEQDKEEENTTNFPMPNMGGDSQQPGNETIEQPQESPSAEGEGGSNDMNEDTTGETDESVNGDRAGDAPSKDIEPEVRTADSLQEKLEDLIDDDTQENVYVEIPTVDLKHIIAANDDVHASIDRFFNRYFEAGHTDTFNYPDTQYLTFKRSAQKEVNYLVKEFECRKAADSYARATTARTGVLDCSKLHTYKYNEDLFKKVTTLADGKNHGLIFILDWSGSMNRVLLDTVKQLYNLIWFCNKTSIPFDVYAFTNEWKRPEMNDEGEYEPVELKWAYERKENQLCISDHFSMMNILSSKTNTKKLEKQMINIWRIAMNYSKYGMPYSVPDRLSLSGTPLNEALCCMHQILPKFQKENKLQKVQCIVLTDGEAGHLGRHVEVKRPWEAEPYMGHRQLYGGTTFLRDRKIGTTYQVPYGWCGFTEMLLRNLRDKFSSVNFIGIRVLENRDATSFIKRFYEWEYGDDYKKAMNDWKKLRSFSIKNSGYHAYFGLSSSSLSQDAEFDVDEGASKAKIKSAFIKSLKVKKLNKKVLGEFISLVA